MKFWPFNRKKKNADTPTGITNFTQATTRKASIGSVLGSFITAFIILVAGGTGIGISAWKQTLGSEYSKSYNIRYELDPRDEQAFEVTAPKPAGDESYADLAKDSANAYSRYLHERGVDDINVYPEWAPDSTEPQDKQAGRIFINAVVPNDYYYNTVDEKRIEVPKEDIFMNYMNSSRLTVIVQNAKEKKFSILPLKNYIDTNHISINSSNPTEVDIKLKASFDNIVEANFDTTTDTNGTNADENNNQIYIVQNYYELLNYLTFILQVGASQSDGSNEFTDVYNYWKQNQNGNNGELDFYEKYSADHNRPKRDEATLGNAKLTPYTYGKITAENNPSFEIGDEKYATNPTGENIVTDALFYIESKKENDDADWKPSDSINYNFLKKYVLAFGQPDKKDAEVSEQSANSFLKILPNKNPTNTKEKSNWQWLTINTGDRYFARTIVNGTKNYQFPLPIKAITTDGYTEGNTKSILGNIDSNTSIIEQTFKNTAFGLSPIIGLIISLCLVILGIGIIVSILYRIPGAFGVITIIGSFGLTLMTLILSNYVVSLGLLLGLLVGVLGTTLSVFSWCNRIKRLSNGGLIFDVAVRKGIKRGFLPTVDIHLILLLLGMCISYFGANQIFAFGNALLIFSVISFVLTGLVWMLMTLLLFNNRIGAKKIKWFTKNKKEKQVSLGLEKNYETTYSGKFETKRFTVFGWKQIVCASLIGVIALIGVILILTVGVHTSYAFYGGSRLMMSEFTYDAHPGDFVGYSELLRSNGFVYLYYDYSFDLTSVSFKIQPLDDKNPWQLDYVSLQSISAAGVLDYTRTSIYMILIVSGLISVYTFIRLNWVSIIPVFIGSLATPLLTIGIVSICQIYFDAYVIMAITIVYALNAFLIINLVSTLNNHWIRKQIFTTQDLRKIFNAEVKNSLTFYLWCYGMLVGAFVTMLLFNTTTLIWFYLIVIIGILASIPVMYAVVPACLYLFVRLRYRYLLSNNFENPLLRKNYDAVDEQLIDGINQFKRKKPTL